MFRIVILITFYLHLCYCEDINKPLRLAPVHVARSSAISPFFAKFVKNQRKGFPFPGGKECEHDAHKLCPGILKRCVGSFGCTTQCLADHMPKLSPKCKRAHPCYPSMDKYCADVQPGQNAMMKCLKKHLDDLNSECLKHHPCLKKAHPHSCQILDYSGKAPTFVKDIQSFLGNLRSGSFFDPIKGILDRDEDNFRPRNRFPFFLNKHRVGSRLHSKRSHNHGGSTSTRTREIKAEQEHLRKERKMILEERRELERERKNLLDKVTSKQRSKKKDTDSVVVDAPTIKPQYWIMGGILLACGIIYLTAF